MFMPGSPSRAALAVLVLLALVLASGTSSALPGDLTVELALEQSVLEARPTEAEDAVTFDGNVTFAQPRWQYAEASLTATMNRNWTVTVSPATVTHRGDGTEPFTVTVTVPPTARGREVASLRVVAEYSTRLGDPATTEDSANVRVASWFGYRMNVTSPVQIIVPQGTTSTLRVDLENVGNEPEYFSTSAPYWFGLRRYGLTVETPTSVLVEAKEEATLEFPITARIDAVPRAYVFDLVVNSQSLLPGGTGAEEDPRTFQAEVLVTGFPPPEDPYAAWVRGEGPETLPPWESVFGSAQPRRNPDIDPSGERIVFDQPVDGESAVHIGEVSGAGAQRLTRGHYDHHAVFSPNGRMIAFARDPDRIMVVNLNGTELMEFGTELGRVNLTDWSPSGDRILLDSGGNIHELDIRSNVTRMLAGEPVDQWGAVYSPDGGTVYYISYEAAGRRSEIWSMSSDGGDHRQLTFNDLTERFVSVSPNGKRVAFTLSEADLTGDRVCVMNTDGSDVRFFTDRTNDVYLVRWLPDGKAILAEVSGGGGEHDIQRVTYPWRDAGFTEPDGGGGSGGGGGSLSELPVIDWLLKPSVCLTILLVIAVAVGAIALRRRRERARAESAQRLREVMERHGPSAPALRSHEIEYWMDRPGSGS
jgi:Tol biopolymer transport system component